MTAGSRATVLGPLLDAVEWRALGEDGAPPVFLAQAAPVVDLVDLYGEPRRVVLPVAGMGRTPPEAVARCRGELVERVVAALPECAVRHVHAARDAGAPTVATSPFVPYRQATLAEMGGLGPVEDFVCVARGLATGRSQRVPAALVMPSWHEYVGDEHMPADIDTSGLASWGDVDGCALAGLREVLERDALMLAWRRPDWPVADLAADRLDAALRAHVTVNAGGLRLYDVGDPRLCPVVLALVGTPGRGLTCGSAAGRDLGRLAEKAVLEALMVRDSVLATPAEEPTTSAAEVETSLAHVRWGFRAEERILAWFSALPRRPESTAAAGPALPDLVERASAVFGAEPLAVDLSCPDVDPSALVRVMVPNAQRKEWLHRRPFLGGPRLARDDGKALNLDPHPYG